MPVSRRGLARAVGAFMENENLKVTVTESGKAALIMGASVLLGGLLGGRKGILAGAELGGLIAMSATKEFKPIGEIMDELSEEQMEEIKDAVENVVGKLKYLNYTALVNAMGSSHAKYVLLHSLKSLFEGFGYQVMQN